MALSVDTLLPTPQGWTSVYDLKVGTVLIDEIGQPCRVTEVSDLYPSTLVGMSVGWGKRLSPEGSPIRCSPDQKLFTILRARIEGLNDKRNIPKSANPKDYILTEPPTNWTTWTRGDIARSAPSRGTQKTLAQERSAREVSESLTYVKNRKKSGPQYYLNHSIPTTFSLQLPDKDYKIPPYLIGLLVQQYDMLSRKFVTSQEFFYYYKAEFAKAGFDLISPLEKDSRVAVRKLYCSIPGLHEVLEEIGFNACIPPEYLRGSHQQRYEVVQGLLDQFSPKYNPIVDSSIVSIRAKSESLWHQISELVRSLGFPAYAHQKFQNAEDTWNPYRFVSYHPPTPPYRHPKLLERYRHMARRYGSQLERYFWKVYTVEESGTGFVRDIVVDSPTHMFSATELFFPLKDDAKEKEAPTNGN